MSTHTRQPNATAQYFFDRLRQIAESPNPRVARWTPTDRLYLSWLLEPYADSLQEPPSVLEHREAIDTSYRASQAFVVAYAEYERATDVPSRYNTTLELEAVWAALLS